MKMIVKTSIAAAAMGAMLASGILIGQAVARQPHMEAALDALHTAKSELEMASHNKGGHRVEALRLTNEAIHEVEMGMADAD